PSLANAEAALAAGASYIAFGRFFDTRTKPGAFFFQAEDGIRDFHVTGVQTCALPILSGPRLRDGEPGFTRTRPAITSETGPFGRSEERRLGKEGRSRGSPQPQRRKASQAAEARTLQDIEKSRVIMRRRDETGMLTTR